MFQSLLGCYLEVVEMDFVAALDWELKAAEQGYAIAQLSVGWHYEQGKGVKQDISMALKWYQKAAEQNLGWAEASMAKCYDDMKDMKSSYHWYQRAADHGFVPAMFSVGYCYEHGEGVPQNLEKAVMWYWRAAELGNEKGQQWLASAFRLGRGVQKNLRLAFYWHSKAVANMKERGEEVEYDESKILYYCEKAVLGDGQAQVELGNLYWEGKYGLPQDWSMAMYWYRCAAESKHPEGYLALANCYARGRGVDTDLTQALHYFLKGAELGHAGCQYELGNMYYNGTEMKKNIPLAVHWWMKAAEDEFYTFIQFKIAKLLETEPSVQNVSLAACYYQKAAERGNTNAMTRVANFYSRGYGVQQDFNKAFEWYQKAADKDNELAQKKLGYCYHYGEGVEQNFTKALEWFKVSQLDFCDEMKRYYSCQKCPKEEGGGTNPKGRMRRILEDYYRLGSKI